MAQRLIGTPPVFFERFAFPGKYRHACGGDSGCGVILRGEDVAACPAYVRAEIDQRFNQNGGLNGHVQRSGNPHPCQRLFCRIFLANGHQAGHFLLGDGDFFAAPIGQTQVGDFVVCRGAVESCCTH